MMQLTKTHNLQWLAGNGKITAECSCNGWSNTFLYMDLIARAASEEQLTQQFEVHKKRALEEATKFQPKDQTDYECRIKGSDEAAQKLVDGW